LTKQLNIIQFTVIDNGNNSTITTHHGSHPNLMFLLKEKLSLDSFGECGGVGRCATCVVEVFGIKGKSAVKERNEPTTLSKMGFDEGNIRLSCQIYITSDLNGATIELIDI
jgi:2Fe-2S ferredoxin